MPRSRIGRGRAGRTVESIGRYPGVNLISGTLSTGAPFLCLKPTNWNAASPQVGIIYCHPFGGSCTNIIPAGNQPTLMSGGFVAPLKLAQAGYIVLGASVGDTWGNTTSNNHITAANTKIHELGAKTGAIGFVGTSMGGFTALNWIRANLASTLFYMGMVPGCDLNDIHANNRGGAAASINTAYGGAYNNGTMGATANPTTYASSLAGKPIKMWYGDSDSTALPALCTGLVTAIGGSAASAVSVSGNHATAVLNIPVADMITFAQAND